MRPRILQSVLSLWSVMMFKESLSSAIRQTGTAIGVSKASRQKFIRSWRTDLCYGKAVCAAVYLHLTGNPEKVAIRFYAIIVMDIKITVEHQ